MRFSECIEEIAHNEKKCYTRIHSKYGEELLYYGDGFVEVARTERWNGEVYEAYCPDMEDIQADDWEAWK